MSGARFGLAGLPPPVAPAPIIEGDTRNRVMDTRAEGNGASGASLPRPARYLVTGGAGYIGSHIVAMLRQRGDAVAVYDNLRSGHRAAVPADVPLIAADLADSATLDRVLADAPWDAVFHLAGWTQVGESLRLPLTYLRENAGNGIRLIEACVRHGVRRFVLSSTAALFNETGSDPIPETAPIDPRSPYGESKWMIERALAWASHTHGLRSARLRYFNAAGADPAGRLGEDHRPESHLIPLAIDAALGRRPALEVYGDDYPTPDGTCVRDYVHVTDLAAAHLLALARLDDGDVVWNLGNGAGHSVLAVIRATEAVTGLLVPYRITSRRPGDAPILVAASDRARMGGWEPRFGALEDIVRTAFAWRESHPRGYDD